MLFRSSGATKMLGVQITSVTRQEVLAVMHVTDLHLNATGRVNGGILMAFADVLGAAGTRINLPPGHRTTTIESKTNFFAAGAPPTIHAVTIPLHIGRTTMVWETTLRNDDGKRVAIVTQTQIVIPAKETAPAVAPAARRKKP